MFIEPLGPEDNQLTQLTVQLEREKITQNIWYTFVFSILNNQQKIIIITGMVEIIKTPLITWVKFSD